MRQAARALDYAGGRPQLPRPGRAAFHDSRVSARHPRTPPITASGSGRRYFDSVARGIPNSADPSVSDRNTAGTGSTRSTERFESMPPTIPLHAAKSKARAAPDTCVECGNDAPAEGHDRRLERLETYGTDGKGPAPRFPSRPGPQRQRLRDLSRNTPRDPRGIMVRRDVVSVDSAGAIPDAPHLPPLLVHVQRAETIEGIGQDLRRGGVAVHGSLQARGAGGFVHRTTIPCHAAKHHPQHDTTRQSATPARQYRTKPPRQARNTTTRSSRENAKSGHIGQQFHKEPLCARIERAGNTAQCAQHRATRQNRDRQARTKT